MQTRSVMRYTFSGSRGKDLVTSSADYRMDGFETIPLLTRSEFFAPRTMWEKLTFQNSFSATASPPSVSATATTPSFGSNFIATPSIKSIGSGKVQDNKEMSY